MNREKIKSVSVLVVGLIVVFVIPYFWRKNRDADIENNKLYAFGRITKKTGSLKNGNHRHYEFVYNDKTFEDYRPTHVDYDVHIGDYFLVAFSSKNPDHNIILYEYKLKDNRTDVLNQVWDTVPQSAVYSAYKYYKKN